MISHPDFGVMILYNWTAISIQEFGTWRKFMAAAFFWQPSNNKQKTKTHKPESQNTPYQSFNVHNSKPAIVN